MRPTGADLGLDGTKKEQQTPLGKKEVAVL
jgi:hypothetical protein